MSELPPGEQVIKDTGILPVTWTKGALSNVNGKLILTNARLIFAAGHFQDIISAVRGAHRDRVEIPLNTIVNVEKGFMATITVHAGERYTFRGMGDANGWVDAINRARLQSQAAGFAPGPGNRAIGVGSSPYGAPPPPPPPPSGNRFCGQCGAPIPPGNRFCGQCGAPVQQ